MEPFRFYFHLVFAASEFRMRPVLSDRNVRQTILKFIMKLLDQPCTFKVALCIDTLWSFYLLVDCACIVIKENAQTAAKITRRRTRSEAILVIACLDVALITRSKSVVCKQ